MYSAQGALARRHPGERRGFGPSSGVDDVWKDSGSVGTQVSDAGLAYLKELPNLRCVKLDGTRATDAGLKHLVGMSGLEDLLLRETAVTDSGVAELKRALPDLRVAL